MATEQADLAKKLKRVRQQVREDYLAPDHRPWIIGFSGGKDSTLVLQLVVDALLKVAPTDRVRPVFVVCNDTLVESPIVAAYVDRTLERLSRGVGALKLPIQVHKTRPSPDCQGAG